MKITIEMEKLNIYELQKIVNEIDKHADTLDPDKNIRVYERTKGLKILSQNGRRTGIKI